MTAVPLSIAGLAAVPGEDELSAEALAARLGTTSAAVERSLGGARVYATARSAQELGLDAARRALERSAVRPEQVSLLRGAVADVRRLQRDLGATDAWVFFDYSSCFSMAQMLHDVRCAMSTQPFLETALVVSAMKAEDWAPNRSRAFGAVSETGSHGILSDAGGALVIRRGGERLALLGMGAAMTGQHFEHLAALRSGQPPAEEDSRVVLDQMPIFRAALARCLRDAELDIEAVDLALFPSEGDRLPLTFARAARIPRHKVFLAPDVPSHTGAADLVFALEGLRSAHGRPGAIALACLRSVGVVWFLLLRL